MIDESFVLPFLSMTDQRRPASVYRPVDELKNDGKAVDAVWFRCMIRKENLSVRDRAAIATLSVPGVSQAYSIHELIDGTGELQKSPIVYDLCRIYDEEDKLWYTIRMTDRTASDAIQVVFCAAVKHSLTPQNQRKT